MAKRVKYKKVPATTNNITTGIVNTLLADGWSASRINVMGIYKENLYGPGKGGWIPSGSRNGYYDISVCIAGLGIVIDTKNALTGDKIREDQKEFKREWEAAGGIAIEPRTFQEFLDWYAQFKTTIQWPK